MDIYNNKYLVEKEKNKIYGIYINMSLTILIISLLFIINFKYDKTTILYAESDKILIDLIDKNARIKIDDKSYKAKILLKNNYYQAEIILKEYKRIKIEVEQETTIYKSILFDFRKELQNAENIQ